jgi:undecaprenyl-diphosphatase
VRRNRYGLPVLPLGLGVALAASIMMGSLSRGVLHQQVRDFDDAVRAAAHGWSIPSGRDLALAATRLCGPSFLAFACLLIGAWFYRAGRKHDTFILLASMAGGVVLSMVLKEVFARPRPVPYFDLPIPHSYSFPSGHSLASMCFFSALAIISGRGVRGARHALVWLLADLAILWVGFSRIYLGVHYPSDVIGGFLVGVIWMAFVWMADHHWKPDPAGPER